MANIGWFLGAHPTLVYHPSFTELLNNLIAHVPTETFDALVAQHTRKDDKEPILPWLFVNKNLQHFGAPLIVVLPSHSRYHASAIESAL